MTNDGAVLAPGSMIGILGGGQLGRMLALAAANLGLKCHVFAPEPDSPAFDVSAARTVAQYRDEAALAAFAASIDAATFEFENVPVETVRFLEARLPVRPGSKALETAQDRILEKRLARDAGAMTVEFAAVETLVDVERCARDIGLPAILKTTRFGYDGKGQKAIRSLADAPAAFAAMRGAPAIFEAFADFQSEVSVIAARGHDGAFAAFDITQNEHRDHILHRSTAPAILQPEAAREAVAITQAIAARLDYVGVIAVEFFVLEKAGGHRLLVNEIAPRVHNSGHWTQDGADASQFEQHIRAVAGWPLGSPRRRAASVEMVNLIGDDAARWHDILASPGAKLHLYGKAEARPGRKMGHVNRLVGNLRD
jgi:5-(carboxyamino)imidazole ribonucleotide synthase